MTRGIDELPGELETGSEVLVSRQVNFRFCLSEFNVIKLAWRTKGIVNMEGIEVECTDLAHSRLDQKIEQIRPGSTESYNCDDVILELNGQVAQACSPCECILKLEDWVGWTALRRGKCVRSDIKAAHCRAGDGGGVVLDLLEEIDI